jgi:hypothetical protein
MNPANTVLETIVDLMNALNSGVVTCAEGGATAPTQQAAHALHVECPWWLADLSVSGMSVSDSALPTRSAEADA